MLTTTSLRLKILTALLVIVGLNLVLSYLPLRLDFTGDKRYTLSPVTRDIVSQLKKPVTITGYFSANLPPQVGKIQQDFEDLVAEYNSRSGGKVSYKAENPNASQEAEQQAMQQGIQPQAIQMRERDQVKEQRAYFGAKLQYEDQTEIIPIIQPGAAMEYALSSAIKKMSGTDKPRIAWVGGHGEASLRTVPQAVEGLSVSYTLEPVALTDSLRPEAYQAMAIVAPADTFRPADLQHLDRWLASGKSLFLALNAVQADLQSAAGAPKSTGLEAWLATKGIDLMPSFVIDAKCAPITVQQNNGFMTFQQQIAFPYLPLIHNFAEHPAVKGIEQVILPFASPIKFRPQNGVVFTPLAFTSDNAGVEPAPTNFDINKQLNAYNYNAPRSVVGAAIEGSFGGSAKSKILLYGDGDFAVNGEGQRQQALAADNINLLVNGMDWLCNNSGLNELRTKAVSSRPIQKELGEAGKNMVRWLNFLAPIGLVLLYGFFRYQGRKAKRRAWQASRFS